MKQKFSRAWVGSKQPRKQRKYRHNAPLHIKHRFLSALLSAELRKEHGKRNIPIKKGDEVLIMRGKFSKKQGKILEIDLKNNRVSVENMNRSKKDGTKVNVYFHPSNLRIISLSARSSKKEKHPEQKTETKPKSQEKENASKEKPSN